MSKIKCFKCGGKGWVTDVDWLCGVLTLGLAVLVDLSDRETCDACDGKGWIEG